ncbi:MAG: Gfo/Idh/MocA family oxidoreductase [Planctomycetia bacterium]|nr:Gfo/Idh/MocA family oxidoreductase [Planctomycetia bacterium]
MTQNLARREFLKYVTQAAALTAGACVPGCGKPQTPARRPIRVGIIGLDTSHAVVFTKHLNRDNSRDIALNDVRVIAAFPAGNADFPPSADRVQRFTRDVRALNVQIVDSISELLPLVDAVLLESVDGRQHLDQARPVISAGIPLFIDKPLAASLSDALAIAAFADENRVPWMTSSSSRFTPGYPELRTNERVGKILGCDIHSQTRAAIGHPDLYWYGVHGVDLLYLLMGPGCERVSAVQTPYSEFVVVCCWNLGRGPGWNFSGDS